MYEANAALRHALGVAIPALRHDQIDAAATRLVAHPAFTEALALALVDDGWIENEAAVVASVIKTGLAAPTGTTAMFDPHAGMETR